MTTRMFDGGPPVFSYVIGGFLAGHGVPTTEGHMKWLEDEGIKYVVTLMDQVPDVIQKYKSPYIESVQLRIRDYTAPSLNQILNFVKLVEQARAEGAKISAHCIRGMGRTGVMLACYLVKAHHLTGRAAVNEIRRLRPGSIETKEQEEVVEDYAQFVRAKTHQRACAGYGEGCRNYAPPPVFSYVVDDLLAAHGLPSTEGHMKFLRNEGIKYVVTLMEEVPDAILKYKSPNTCSVLIRIRDYTPPTMTQVIEFVQLVEQAKAEQSKVSMHCIRGMGRTGTLIACFFVKAFGMLGRSAIDEVRRLRPGSIETCEQEALVESYAKTLAARL